MTSFFHYVAKGFPEQFVMQLCILLQYAIHDHCVSTIYIFIYIYINAQKEMHNDMQICNYDG